MADIMDVIKGRRSVRRYLEKDIPEEVIGDILEAVRWSQSWANTQCWEVVVIRDKALREQLQATVPEGNPSKDAIVSAPVLLALCGKLECAGYYKGSTPTKFGDWFMFDLGLATQNLALAAHALGLGSVVVGMFDHDKARDVIRVPEGCELVTLMPLGYPAKTPSAPDRKETGSFTHYDTF